MCTNRSILSIVIVSLCLGFTSIALADRSDRSSKNLTKAMLWCDEYQRTHTGLCKVVRMIRTCPFRYTKAKSFKKFRSRGYKTCIRGKKIKRLKKYIKKTNKPITKITKKTTKGIGKATKKSTKATARFIKKTTPHRL